MARSFMPFVGRVLTRRMLSNLSKSAALVVSFEKHSAVKTRPTRATKERNANGKDLFEKINDLATQGVLTKDGADILHKLRVLGNKAAHEVKPHSTEQLNLSMDVIEHLLLGVYIFPYHAKNKLK